MISFSYLTIRSTVQSVHVSFMRITQTIFSFYNGGFLLIDKVELRIVLKNV